MSVLNHFFQVLVYKQPVERVNDPISIRTEAARAALGMSQDSVRSLLREALDENERLRKFNGDANGHAR